MRSYFYSLLYKYLSLYIFSSDRTVAVHPVSDRLLHKFSQAKVVVAGNGMHGGKNAAQHLRLEDVFSYAPDFVLLDGVLHYERDIQTFLDELVKQCHRQTRLVVTFYSALWKPFIMLATILGLRNKLPEENWIAPVDVHNLLRLSGFEVVRAESRVLIPVYIPVLSNLVNRYISPLPFFNLLNFVNIIVARPASPPAEEQVDRPSVSVVVAARNEEGNIDDIIRRLPKMGPDDELIIIEGNSTDNTWAKIQEVYAQNKDRLNMRIGQQDGRGKGDAVRKGFAMATKDILMILDADLTVPPEDLPKFYRAIVTGKGEFINGSRLVYPMEEKAMRFFNIVGNKFFALAFSFVLGQRFKDTLCGTKVLSRVNYEKLASHRAYFGEFDPFGDFDLIFGAARMCLKIVEVPIRYRERLYGDTNISRWRHGVILLRMLWFAARKIKFI